MNLKLQKISRNVKEAKVKVEFTGADYYEELIFTELKLFFNYENTEWSTDFDEFKIDDSLVANILILNIPEE